MTTSQPFVNSTRVGVVVTDPSTGSTGVIKCMQSNLICLCSSLSSYLTVKKQPCGSHHVTFAEYVAPSVQRAYTAVPTGNC